MIQVVYIQYMSVKVKRFEGDSQVEDAMSFIDALRSYLFEGGVVLMVLADEWSKTRLGDRSEHTVRMWMDERAQKIDDRLDEWIQHEGVQPCLHCDAWCDGKCRGSTKCLQAGKPGHTHCKSRLIETGVLKRRP